MTHPMSGCREKFGDWPFDKTCGVSCGVAERDVLYCPRCRELDRLHAENAELRAASIALVAECKKAEQEEWEPGLIHDPKCTVCAAVARVESVLTAKESSDG